VSGRGGFTLVEVLVALTVASLALLAGMSALGFVADRSRHADAATTAAVSGATQRALLVDWLSAARFRAPTGEQFEGLQGDEGGDLVDLLLFPTTARTPLAGSSTVVGLYIDMDPETPERGLVAELTGMTFGAPARRMELVPEAAVMEIRYLPNGAGAEWEETWLGRNSLPRAIELTLHPAPGDSLPLLLRYPVRVSLAGIR
jgi:prepilin-type N-terminal cleavage/methylation domain-containing protein